jgi:hypothetical protein
MVHSEGPHPKPLSENEREIRPMNDLTKIISFNSLQERPSKFFDLYSVKILVSLDLYDVLPVGISEMVQIFEESISILLLPTFVQLIPILPVSDS